MESKTTKPFRHCPGQEYEISIFICRGRQKAHYPKCPECEFRTITEEISPVPAKKESKKSPPAPPPRQVKTGSIMVKSDPPSAEIYLDNDHIGTTPAIITQILPGKYKIKLKMNGYDSWSQSVDVKANRETSLTAVLQGRDGSIVIESNPTKAEIFVDGNKAGVTPETINSVKPGKYLVEVRLEGYETWSQEISVEAEKKTTLTANLTTNYGSISLGSEPTKAIIFLDGVEIGTTPASLRSVPHGTHQVEVRMDGYSIWEKSVDVEPGKEKVVTAILQVKTGSASIKSQPKNARIYLDGKYIGTTPERIPSIIPGTHEIKVNVDDYDVWSETINVEAGKENVITAVLQRSTGSLMVESVPENAMILVDGKEIGHTPEIVMSSAKGTHTIEVRMDGYDVWKQNVDIEPGTEKSLTATLQVKSGSLNIKSDPSGGTIFLDGKVTGTTPDIIKSLKPDTHMVEVRMDGYEKWNENVEISADQEKHLTAVLRKLTGTLNIKSEPANAMIIIDGNEVGNTPASITDLVPGTHQVEVRMEGYGSWNESVDIEHSKETALTTTLQQLTGSLNIKSKPSNAMVIVDGNEVENTPASITDLIPGKHRVEIRTEGYENWNGSVNIEHSREVALTATLQQLKGSLNIKSEPPDAMIIIDGNEVGNTPASITDLVPGTHQVEIRMEGYENWNDSVDIEHNKEAALTATLQQLTGSLNIKSKPENAIIFINGKEAGSSPIIINELIPGTLRVEARKDGYETWSDSVNIIPNKEITLTAELQTISGSLSIFSEPPDAEIFIDGKKVGTTPLILTDPDKGEHLVEVRREGYEGWSESVNIISGKETSLTAQLQLKAGSVCIKSKPSIAAILIDGKEVGTTPLIITDPSPGTHNVEVKKDGYENWSESVDIEPGKEAILTAVLQLNAGSVTINSMPPKALILIDGKKIGTTPLNISNPDPGKHAVEVRMDGYETWNESFDIESGKDITITADLQMKAGSININSNPSDATINIDGKNAGKTPETIMDLSPGMHLVEITKEGHEAWSESVEVRGDKENTITANLQLITGSVNIKSSPSEAIIFLDGEKIGITPDALKSVAIGAHEVEIKLEGYAEWQKTINIKKGKEITLNAVLQSNTGIINIESDPTEATILLDGKEIGKTPLSLTDTKIGMFEVEIQKDGYVPWKKTIKVKAGKENILTAKLMEMTGSVNINSKPSNAVVYIDGSKSGSTPALITGLSSGEHQVEVRHEGYDKWSESIEIKPGIEIMITAELQMKAGLVSIKSIPSEALILIDGKEAGTTPKTITNLSPEKHLVEVKMDSYEVWSESIDIKPGIELSITAKLQMKAGSVSVNSEPSNAIILIDGKEAGTTPKTLTDIMPGKHHVEVRKEEFETWVESVDVRGEKENILVATLKKITGSISIKCDQSEAIIFLDGEEVGTRPGTIQSISIGTHEVEIKLDGYAEWKKKINIKKGEEVILNAVLQPITGTVNLESEPNDAIILLDGEKVGKTPKIMTGIKTGNHEVEVQMDGYISWMKTLKVKAGREYTLAAVLQRMSGSLMISSEPSHAIIYIQGKKIGKTPRTITKLQPGNYTVEVKLDKHKTWSEIVEILPGKETILKAELQANPGFIRIKSNPSGAKITIDGKDAGTTQETINDIEPGIHIVELKVEGYELWNKNVEVKANKEFFVKAVLQEMTGSISLISEPSNATILVNGKKSGSTPGTLKNLKPGIYQVELRKDEFENWNNSVEVTAGKENKLIATLQQLTCFVNVDSKPTGATVLIDNKETGITPQTIKDLSSGKHKVEVRLNGFEDWSENIIVVPDKKNAVTALLQQSTGAVNIKSDPSNAMILIDGKKAGATPASINDLSPGTHVIDISLDGYADWRENVDIISGKEIPLTASLKLNMGSLKIMSDPSNAKTIINGKETDTTPTTQTDLKPGTHNVKILKNGYEDWTEDVNILPGKEVALTATLQYKAGSVNVKSDPSDSKVFVDAKEAGTTPFTITDLKPGSYMLEVRKTGYESWTEKVVVETDKKSSIVATLKKITGSISVKSTPSKAKIYIDGEDSGTTPATLRSIPVGPHEIAIKIDGYEDWKKSLTVKKDKEISVNSILQLNIGSISIESYPENAKIFLDGKEVGKTPKRLTDIIIGTHEVEVLLDGYITWAKTIKLRAGKEISLTADLKEVTDTLETIADNTIKTPEIEKPITHEIPESTSRPERGKEETLTQQQKSKAPAINKKTKSTPDELITLRSTYDKIAESKIESLPFISIHENNNNIFFCHCKINHHYEVKPIGDGDVIIDHTTKLMWYQAGSSEYFNLRKATKWLKKANKNCYAGFNDWRLPTLEEAFSLLTFEAKNGGFIDPAFDNKQWGTWTGDKSDRGHAWVVTFVNGTISQSPVGAPATFIRPVRSLNI